MTKGYLTVKRLWLQDRENIEKCYKNFDFLHFNPLSRDRIEDMLIDGEIWGVWRGEKIVACSTFTTVDKKSFSDLNAYWNIRDLLDDDLSDYLICSYVWIEKDYSDKGIYAAFDKLWQVAAAKGGKKQVLHYMPAHINFDIVSLFDCGYGLVGLRGFDKLVPHYIFTRPQEMDKTEYLIKDEKICRLTDTKEISKLCEHKFTGIALDDSGQNIIFTNRS